MASFKIIQQFPTTSFYSNYEAFKLCKHSALYQISIILELIQGSIKSFYFPCSLEEHMVMITWSLMKYKNQLTVVKHWQAKKQ